MRILIFLLFSFVSCGSFGSSCSSYESLSPIQKGRLEFAYYQGLPVDLGYTMASIALVESNAGLWRLNIHSKDVGLFQVNIKTAANTLGVTNHYKRLELDQKLIYDDILNAYIARSVLQYFLAYHEGNWRDMIQSYNEGFKINTDKSKKYLAKIKESVIMLQQCMILN